MLEPTPCLARPDMQGVYPPSNVSSFLDTKPFRGVASGFLGRRVPLYTTWRNLQRTNLKRGLRIGHVTKLLYGGS